jgi:C4-dicarboxylate-specific signal transduction histidine kinase
VKSNLAFLEREARGGKSLDCEELCEVLSETRQGVLRIQQIVTDLKDFSRAGNGGDEARGVLEEAVLEAKRLASVRLRERGDVLLALDPGLPAVRLEQRRVVQVMLNLMLNAADAVELADPTCQAHITVRAWRVEEGVRVEVDDNGPGIPLEVLPRLFEPFFTTKPPGRGTGLGLALCREYVSRVGGSLHAENRPGGGARFVLRLPVAPASVTAMA